MTAITRIGIQNRTGRRCCGDMPEMYGNSLVGQVPGRRRDEQPVTGSIRRFADVDWEGVGRPPTVGSCHGDFTFSLAES